jgi:hypothetical protein
MRAPTLPRSLSTRLPLVLVLLLATSIGVPGIVVAGGPWLGPDGKPLPFSSDEELLAFLTTAPVVETKQLSDGINRPERLTLERDGIRVRAIFRNVDDSRTSDSSAIERQYPSFRDRYIFEVAAYELSRMLGLDNVPPAALYRWNGQQGSIQLWVEGARPESKRIAAHEQPDDPSSWIRQRYDMMLFDSLIYNFDRNHGNQLLDASGKLWFIDHTRSFKRQPILPSKEKIKSVDSALWDRLRTLDPIEVRDRLSPYLNELEMKALLKRHKLLVQHVESMIAERGELEVLINAAGWYADAGRPSPTGP